MKSSDLKKGDEVFFYDIPSENKTYPTGRKVYVICPCEAQEVALVNFLPQGKIFYARTEQLFRHRVSPLYFAFLEYHDFLVYIKYVTKEFFKASFEALKNFFIGIFCVVFIPALGIPFGFAFVVFKTFYSLIRKENKK